MKKMILIFAMMCSESAIACPTGWYASGNYCLPSSDKTKPAIIKNGNTCPTGWYSSGCYCLKSNVKEIFYPKLPIEKR